MNMQRCTRHSPNPMRWVGPDRGSAPVRRNPRASPIGVRTTYGHERGAGHTPYVPNPSVTPAAMSAKRLTGEQATGGTISIVAARALGLVIERLGLVKKCRKNVLEQTQGHS